jgi:hypothetical protein
MFRLHRLQGQMISFNINGRTYPVQAPNDMPCGQPLRGIGICWSRMVCSTAGNTTASEQDLLQQDQQRSEDRHISLTLGNASASDESGIEMFYNFAVTPAVRLIPSYRHIWHPRAAEIAKGLDHADLFLTRLTVAW